jgi:hypothetical protein
MLLRTLPDRSRAASWRPFSQLLVCRLWMRSACGGSLPRYAPSPGRVNDRGVSLQLFLPSQPLVPFPFSSLSLCPLSQPAVAALGDGPALVPSSGSRRSLLEQSPHDQYVPRGWWDSVPFNPLEDQFGRGYVSRVIMGGPGGIIMPPPAPSTIPLASVSDCTTISVEYCRVDLRGCAGLKPCVSCGGAHMACAGAA